MQNHDVKIMALIVQMSDYSHLRRSNQIDPNDIQGDWQQTTQLFQTAKLFGILAEDVFWANNTSKKNTMAIVERFEARFAQYSGPKMFLIFISGHGGWLKKADCSVLYLNEYNYADSFLPIDFLTKVQRDQPGLLVIDACI